MKMFLFLFLAPFQMKPQVQETKEPNGVIRNGTETLILLFKNVTVIMRLNSNSSTEKC